MADTITPNIQLTNQTEGGNNNSWGAIADANFEEIDDKFGDVTDITTTGATTTLTTSQEIVNAIEVSGSLVTDATIVFSGRGGSWIVANDTTGDFSVTAKVSGQDGVIIQQGERRVVYSNGIDIKYAQEVNESTPIGAVTDYLPGNAPAGWLFLFGQAISRTTYSALFNLIGVTYGIGDGTTTFNLPDCRGRVVAGKDNMGGSAASRITTAKAGFDGLTLGAAGGVQSGVLARSALPNVALSGTTSTNGAHTHGITVSPDRMRGDGSDGKPFEPASEDGEGGTSSGVTTEGNHNHSFTTDSMNGGVTQTEVNNMQPTIIMNKIVYTGVLS